MKIIIILLLSISLIPLSHAQFIYSTPPPNDTCLFCQKHKTPHHRKTIIHKKKHSVHKQSQHARKILRRYRRQGTLLIYYATPAPACCGDTWVVNRCEKNTAVFHVAPEDLIYNATNDDDYPPFRPYWNEIGDDTRDNPE